MRSPPGRIRSKWRCSGGVRRVSTSMTQPPKRPSPAHATSSPLLAPRPQRRPARRHHGDCPQCRDLPAGQQCCRQPTHSFTREELARYQPDVFGSPEWERNMNRRSRVEGFFGMLKNKAVVDLCRSTMRFFEFGKRSLAVTHPHDGSEPPRRATLGRTREDPNRKARQAAPQTRLPPRLQARRPPRPTRTINDTLTAATPAHTRTRLPERASAPR